MAKAKKKKIEQRKIDRRASPRRLANKPTKFQMFMAWEKADTITGATVTGMLLTLFFLMVGGEGFRSAFGMVAHTLPYLFLFLTVYYCMDKAVCLMKRRNTPLLDPEHCVGLSVWQMIVIAITGNLASGGFIVISIIITVFVMATMNPEAFREILEYLTQAT